MTSQARSLEREMTILRELYNTRVGPMRLLDFGPMLASLRRVGDGDLFPLNRTTVHSTLKRLLRAGLIDGDLVMLVQHKVMYYKINQRGVTVLFAHDGVPELQEAAYE